MAQSAQHTYIFKITPNNKEVIIEPDILINGFRDVSYPIPFKSSNTLGYVIDPDTFKFVDTSSLIHEEKPYPVKIEMSLKFSDLPFYGRNKFRSEDSTACITYSSTKPVTYSLTNNKVNINNCLYEKTDDTGTYDYGEFCHYNTNYTGYNGYETDNTTGKGIKYNAQYYISIKLYWSDGKSHASEIDFNSTGKSTNAYPLTIDIEPEVLITDGFSEQYSSVYSSTTTSNIGSKNKFNFPEDLITGNILLLNLPDNFTEYPRDAVKFRVSTTFTDPTTFRSVYTYDEVIVQQNAYIGYKQGYLGVKFVDTLPLEIWSPTIYYKYAKSTNDEANVKVDKKLFTEYYAFGIDGSFVIDYNNYKYFKGEYYSGVYPTSKITTEEKNVTIGDISTKHYIINDTSMRLYRENGELGHFKLDSLYFDNYYVNEYIHDNQDNIDGLFSMYDAGTIFNDTDVNNFKHRFNICINEVSINYRDTSNDYYQVAENDDEDDNNYTLSLPEVPKSGIYDVTSVDTSGYYRALYAKYVLVGDKYYTQCSSISYIEDTNDLDCEDIILYNKTNNTSIKSITSNNGIKLNYKVTSDENGNSIQYKYCVNNILTDNVHDTSNNSYLQVPRYAVYPILSGFLPVVLEVYDYEDDGIPVITLKKTYIKDRNEIVQNFIYRSSTGEIVIDNSSLNDIIKNIDPNSGYNIAGATTIQHADGNSSTNRRNVQALQHTSAVVTTDGNIISPSQAQAKQLISNYSMNYGVTKSNNNSYTISLNNITDTIKKSGLRVNGVPVTSDTFTMASNVPNLNTFILSIDNYPYDTSDMTLTVNITGGTKNISGYVTLTNDENEKHLTSYTNKGYDINNDSHTFMLLRANPKLSGNVKLVVDSSYNLYLDTFKANSLLNNSAYRKYPISDEGNYPRDIKTVFKNVPTNNLFAVNSNAYNPHKVYNDFNDQYDTMYEYGAETNTDNLYSENMKILAPLHIGNDVPEFFTIFRYNDVFNEETYNGVPINNKEKFLSLLKDSDVVKTFDLRTHTSIGQYLNNYKNMLTNYGQCYLQFIEQDYDQNSPSYRQGNNIWKGISVKRGILADQSETTYFGSKILNSSTIKNKQEQFNNYIIAGFERHNLLYPNIINLEFMFNDEDTNIKEYEMNRYFGLYLTANDFINYGFVISDNENKNNIIRKYDESGNLYKGDSNIYDTIFMNKYSDRLFYAITNNYADRIKNEIDLNSFLNKYVKNVPEENLVSLKADKVEFDSEDKSFITLHFSKPLSYGEHIKFIALNYAVKNTAYTNVGNVDSHKNNVFTHENIVYEIIASNDERLKDSDNHISPYVNTQKCMYSENTYFYRISFYSQDINYPEITATLQEQINRIIACIDKFNTFMYVSHSTKNTLSIISQYDEMYIQHIDAPVIGEFKYDYFGYKSLTDDIYTTNDSSIIDSISFMTTGDIKYSKIYKQNSDDINDWITDAPIGYDTWFSYVETEDPDNIKYDSISYFNADMKYKMHALSNQSDYYSNYYVAFSNYCFETIGWRYNNVVKFKKIKDLYNCYIIYDNIKSVINKVKYPLIFNKDGIYDTINIIKLENGYIRNNLIDPDIYEEYTSEQQLISEIQESPVITSPFDSNYSMISAYNDSLLPNNYIHLYKPTSASISIMGISNIKDIDTTIDLDRNDHREPNLYINISAGVSVLTDESDYRIQHGVMYQVYKGSISVQGSNYGNDNIIKQGYKFLIAVDDNNDTKLFAENFNLSFNSVTSITAETDVVIKIVDRQYYQEYNYNTSIPTLYSNNYYVDINNRKTSQLNYPIVPLVNCSWKSNGQYFDFNNILDVNTLTFDYETKGNFPENVYCPSDYYTNQYITNKIDNIVYVNGIPMAYKDAILNNSMQHPIKKLLIDNTNIEPASAYYNDTVKSLEFIFSGIRFNIKLNTKLVNSYIHLDQYSGFEAFVINDYDLTKTNEIYISLNEKFILLVNHQFYIDYKHEAVHNIKELYYGNYKGYMDYAAFGAPYSIDFSSTTVINNNVVSYKKDNLHKSLMSAIDEHNMWSSLFVQYDVPNKQIDNYNNEPQFISSMLETTSEYNDYVTFAYVPYNVGLLDYNKTNSIIRTASNFNNQEIKSSVSYSHPYIITKADGDYNHQAYTLLNNISDTIKKKLQITETDDVLLNIAESQFTRKLTINEKQLNYNASIGYDNKLKLNNSINKLNTDLQPKTILLSNILKTPMFNVFKNIEQVAYNGYKNIILSKTSLTKLQKYIEKLIALESDKERLERYVSTFTDDIDIYIIPINSEVKLIHNTVEYNPLMFTLSVPNEIKFNHGWFTPNTNNMVEFYVDDELKDVLDVDLLQANTKFKDINTIKNYTGNKVFEDTKLQTLNQNYFILPERSLLSSTWDSDYYRIYNNENDYDIKEGHKTGIDDKAFFGSRCMKLLHEYITLDTWVYNTANDIYEVYTRDSQSNLKSGNTRSLEIDINLTSAVYNHFINNKVFMENWNYFKDSQYTGMKNYVNNTLSTFYNINSTIEVVLYAIDTDETSNINILNEKPDNLDNYYIYENYSTKFEQKNGLNMLYIIINQVTGMNIYPQLKIYKK